jgi:hypothetical protein
MARGGPIATALHAAIADDGFTEVVGATPPTDTIRRDGAIDQVSDRTNTGQPAHERKRPQQRHDRADLQKRFESRVALPSRIDDIHLDEERGLAQPWRDAFAQVGFGAVDETKPPEPIECTELPHGPAAQRTSAVEQHHERSA